MDSQRSSRALQSIPQCPSESALFQGPNLLCADLSVVSGHNTTTQYCSSPSWTLQIILGKVPSPSSGLGFPLPKIMVMVMISFLGGGNKTTNYWHSCFGAWAESCSYCFLKNWGIPQDMGATAFCSNYCCHVSHIPLNLPNSSSPAWPVLLGSQFPSQSL